MFKDTVQGCRFFVLLKVQCRGSVVSLGNGIVQGTADILKIQCRGAGVFVVVKATVQGCRCLFVVKATVQGSRVLLLKI